MPPTLAALDIVAVPSIREGFGLALVEAMAAGKPVVASAAGGMVELASDGETALMVPPGDSVSLAHAINRFIDDDALRMKIAENARKHSGLFSIQRNVEELEALYSRIAG